MSWSVFLWVYPVKFLLSFLPNLENFSVIISLSTFPTLPFLLSFCKFKDTNVQLFFNKTHSSLRLYIFFRIISCCYSDWIIYLPLATSLILSSALFRSWIHSPGNCINSKTTFGFPLYHLFLCKVLLCSTCQLLFLSDTSSLLNFEKTCAKYSSLITQILSFIQFWIQCYWILVFNEKCSYFSSQITLSACFSLK